MLKDQIELLSAFNEHRVEYVVIGGHAVNAYGVPRMTKDLDLFIRVSEANSEAIYRALACFGAPLDGTAPVDFRDRTSIFQIGVEPSRVDILQSIPGVTFQVAWENRIETEIGQGLRVPFISCADLIANKIESGRPQDLADVDLLRRIGRR